MFPASPRTVPTSADPSPNHSPIGSSGPAGPPSPAPGPDAEPPARRAGRWWIAGTAAVLTAGAAAGFLVFRPAGDRPVPTTGLVAPAAVEPQGLALSPVAGSPANPRPGLSSAIAGRPAGTISSPATATTPAGSRTTTPAVQATTTAVTATKEAGGPITAYSACTGGSTAQFAATFTASYSWRHAFVDTDGDTGTGYRVPGVSGGLGADYMIENAVLYRSEGTGWSWSEVEDVSPLVSASGGAYRWRVSLAELDSSGGELRVVFNGSGGSADAYTPVVETGTC
jgi:hypothetical protein